MFDFGVIGGGLVGLATAYRLLEARPESRVALFEKDSAVAMQQSTHNSGVLHAGLYYKPGSEKAILSVRGLRQMVEFCRKHGIRHEICGKIVVATSETELPRLVDLQERARLNGLEGVRRLDAEQIREIEPFAAGIAALHVPQEGIVDYRGVADTLAAEIRRMGGEIVLNGGVARMRVDPDGMILSTGQGEFQARRVVNCAGLHSDRVARLAGANSDAKIVPFRGEYYRIKPDRQHLVRNLIYPVPDPEMPFLGVHFTRLISGGIEAGPNAILALAREGYRKTDINLADLAEELMFPGLWRFIIRHPGTTWQEIRQSFSKSLFCAALRRLVPDIRPEDLEPGGAGVRAQAMLPDGTLVNDFLFEKQGSVLHVINAPSPAATASLAIGERIAGELL